MKFKSREIHLQEVKKLQTAFRLNNQTFSLKKIATSNTLRNGDYKKEGVQIDLSSFTEVLECNPHEGWIVVEPRITFLRLCQFTLSYNLIPLVVPEFTSITVGGAIMGAALESSSHRFGQVNDTCLEYELILGNGELVTVSCDHHPDLFYALAGSYGTLALLTAVKLRLMPAKKWIRLNYHYFQDVKAGIDFLKKPHNVDYIEGIVYSPSQVRVILGEMTERPNGNQYRHNRASSTWYVQHVLQTRNREEYMPIEEYLFRLDRGAFWIGRYVNSFATMARLMLHLKIPKIKKHGYNPNFLFRLLFGWAFSSQRLYQLWHRIPNQISENLFFIHDFYSPVSRALEALSHFMEQTQIFPIWLCPVKGTRTPQILSPHFGGSDFLNIGLYGIPQSSLPIPQLTAQLENKIVEYGGRKMLYSLTYYDRESFSKIYSEDKYDELRQKYEAEEAFPSLYHKIVTNKSGF